MAVRRPSSAGMTRAWTCAPSPQASRGYRALGGRRGREAGPAWSSVCPQGHDDDGVRPVCHHQALGSSEQGQESRRARSPITEGCLMPGTDALGTDGTDALGTDETDALGTDALVCRRS